VSTYQPKTYLIKTYGCQANIADSNKIASILEALGFEEAKKLKDAALFIVNTCSVRQKSDDKAYGLGKVIKKLREETGKVPVCIMAGCVVGSGVGVRKRYELDYLVKKTPWVDLYISPSQINELPNILMPFLVEKGISLASGIKKLPTDLEDIDLKTNGDSAYVNISYGCDNFCTFCVVPYARGKEISRTKEEILKEIGKLVKKGVKNVTLCGQNVNSWGLTPQEKSEIRIGGGQKLPFADLLRSIHDIAEIEKIEFISSNPFDFTQDLIDIFKLPKISNYLHIAVQSGNNDILQAMNRNHTHEEFVDLINRLKIVRPNLEIGTDIIVGFPNETREQFMDTVSLFNKIDFAVAFISMYSPRKGTASFKNLSDNVTMIEKKWRHSYLNKVWRETKKSK
jgi:tRNA-2-methylthio-N6-dimethylallyladenosine synthase